MRHCYVVRVFTVGTDGGNPLGVIPDSTGLSEDDMQAIAARLGFSESVFIFWEKGEITPTLRIFTPAVEMPFAGHPLVGTGWVLNTLGPGAERLRIAIGDVGVETRGAETWVDTPRIDRHVEPDALDLSLGIPGRRAWRVSVPSEYLLVELEHASVVEAAEPNLEAVARLADGLYAFAETGEGIRSRFFAPRLGVDEDPATGSAAVALAAVREHEGIASGASTIVQGPAGHLSSILLEWEGEAVRLGGTVVKDEVRVLDD